VVITQNKRVVKKKHTGNGQTWLLT